MATLAFKLNDNLYLRDPQHTELGQNIIRVSVDLINRLGFEQFTFKKLAEEINSTEASIYRYFENKHRLLLYLVAWYWNWLDYRIDMASSSLQQPEEKLRSALRVLTEVKKYDPSFEFVNEEALHAIVVAELDKTFLTKWVDDDNSAGFFGGFKGLCKKISGFISEINPDFLYPGSLASTVVLAVNQQQFFIHHLSSLSDIRKSDTLQLQHEQLNDFAENLVFNTIKR